MMYSMSPLYREANTNTLQYGITAKRYNGEILIWRKSVISGIKMFIFVFSLISLQEFSFFILIPEGKQQILLRIP